MSESKGTRQEESVKASKSGAINFQNKESTPRKIPNWNAQGRVGAVRYRLRNSHDGAKNMSRDFFDPTWDQTNIVMIDEAMLLRAQRRILSCEECNPEAAEFPFDTVLDEVTGSDPSITDYVFIH